MKRAAALVPLLFILSAPACAVSVDVTNEPPPSAERVALREAISEEMQVASVIFGDTTGLAPPARIDTQLPPNAPSTVTSSTGAPAAPEGTAAVIAPPRSHFLPSLGALLSRWGVEVGPGCIDENVSASDADGDGVPVLASYTLACTSANGSVFGGVLVMDLDDTSATAGYSVGFHTLRAIRKTAAGDLVTRNLEGGYTVRGAAGTLDLSRSIKITVEGSNGSVATTPLVVSLRGRLTFTGEGEVDRRVGAVGSGGWLLVKTGGPTREWKHRTDALRWSAACAAAQPELGGFDRGAIAYEDDRLNTVRVAFEGCGARTITLDGEAL